MFQYLFGSLFRGIQRNSFRMFGMLSLLSVLFFVMFTLLMFHSFTKDSIEGAQKKIDIVFFLEKDIPENKVKLLNARLLKMKTSNQIESFRYITADEGLEIFAKKYPEKFSYWKRNSLDENPLSASFEMTPKESSVEELTSYFLGEDFSGIIDVSKINIIKDSLLRSNKVLEFLYFLEKGILLIVLVILFAIAGVTAAFISSSFVMRQKEIFIMRLVGASHSFIRTPFLVETITVISFSIGIGWGIFYFFRKVSIEKLLSIFSSPRSAQETVLQLNEMWGAFLDTLPWLIGIILLSAFVTAWISIERFLRRKNILQ